MPLASGSRLGPYEILSHIGSGGMGEVYRAMDPRLGREVAVKVLPAEYCRDEGHRQRFLQEARAASALNHPHIVTIHDLVEQDGLYGIVMELVPGRSLDTHIPKHGMRLEEALEVVIPVASALAAAHQAGIVHRDLKPGNILTGDQGLVKLLDFGLAKLREPAVAESDATLTARPLTTEGSIMGTVSYMSPEQAEGRTDIDSRSDVFSFGILFYELLTGRRPFDGDSKMSTLAAIIRGEGRSSSEIAALPREVDRIIRRCLRKEREQRFQDSRDLLLALQDLKEDSASGRLDAQATLFSPAPRSRRWMWTAAAFAGAAVILAAVLGYQTLQRAAEADRATPERLTSDGGATVLPTLSADGKLMAYVSDRDDETNTDLFVQQVPNGNPLRLTRTPEDESFPSLSPDGTRIVFQRGNSGLWITPALGGEEARRIAPRGRAPRFSPDGKEILHLEQTEDGWMQSMRIVPASGGAAIPFLPEWRATSAIWSPDGTKILFVGGRKEEGWQFFKTHWWVVARSGGEPVLLTTKETLAVFKGRLSLPWAWTVTPGGRQMVIYSSTQGNEANLWSIELNQSGSAVSGRPVQLSFGAEYGEGNASVSSQGHMVYSTVTLTDRVYLQPLAANEATLTGTAVPLGRSLLDESNPALSRDGRLLLTIRDREIRLHDLSKRTSEAMFPAGGMYAFSPDGTRIASTPRGKRDSLVVLSAEPGATPRKVAGNISARAWAASNRYIVGQESPPSGKTSPLTITDLQNSTSKTLIQDSEWDLYAANVTSDNRWVAFLGRTKAFEERIFIAPFRPSGSVAREEWISITEGKDRVNKPRFSPDGNWIYFTSSRGGTFAIWAQRLHPGTRQPTGEAKKMMDIGGMSVNPYADSTSLTELSVAQDKMAFNRAEARGNIWRVKLQLE